MNAVIATIIRPNKWNNQYYAQVADENGKTILTEVASAKEAKAHIKNVGAELMTNANFNREVGLRSWMARRSEDVYYNYATNG